jgi:hypothetical protein
MTQLNDFHLLDKSWLTRVASKLIIDIRLTDIPKDSNVNVHKLFLSQAFFLKAVFIL